ncbi:GTP cyclohydrolase 1 type 2/Nif3 [Fimicolochytrium jonesii]|uniref:GTP cyclohydrolase 1 type 2/Nif3 n=1 Tax=Fimicolochytrium jonesii TaxID=1396493 RepID=UPI0022FDD991|nr:GTP cyclohydrolase 1 type 2/Nif3 [Fimicolochytrium jonesii]KAI8816156.1 GTP cyclohydrolase 1 type 2/Nif3 [Fimicolochytrium jonesii]
MALLRNVTRCMEKIAPLKIAEHAWDNVGLLIEAPFPRPGRTVFLTIDLTHPVLSEALANPDIGVIVSYHPPLFKSFNRLTLKDEKQSIALKCAASGVSVYAPHTSLDNCVEGINDWLARGLGEGETRVINEMEGPPEGQEGCGSGRIHTLKQPIPLKTLVERVKKHLGLAHVRLATAPGQESKDVATVAICAGSGASILGGVKADVYFTGEMSHHEVLAALADNTNVILCEHTNTERGFLSNVLQPRLQKLLREEDEGAVVVCSKVDKDPLVVV